MTIFERLITIIAPYQCLHCGIEGERLCRVCLLELPYVLPECYRCRAHTPEGRVCRSCAPYTSLESVIVATPYEGYAKQVVQELKYQRASAHARVMALSMAMRLPNGFAPDVITYVPTATTRVRQRGYDQAQLLARELGCSLNIPCLPLLARVGQQRQVGQGKQIRRSQLRQAFYAKGSNQMNAKHVLLVDDVITTGATLEAAAHILRQSGAKAVSAISFARGAPGLD